MQILARSLADYCDPNPCNNGTCKASKEKNFQCTCPIGSTGETCEKGYDLIFIYVVLIINTDLKLSNFIQSITSWHLY